jgi:hypothetical protein
MMAICTGCLIAGGWRAQSIQLGYDAFGQAHCFGGQGRWAAAKRIRIVSLNAQGAQEIEFVCYSPAGFVVGLRIEKYLGTAW